MLLTALSSALGIAVMAGPAADAARPLPPPPAGQLVVTKALDNGTTLPPVVSPHDDVVGFVLPTRVGVPAEPFTLSIESRVYGSTDFLDVNKDTDITVTGVVGTVTKSWTLTIPKDGHSASIDTATWESLQNFVLTAAGPKGSDYATGSLPVTVGVNAKNPTSVPANQKVGLDCVLTSTNPSCVSVTITGDGAGTALLSTSQCANFLGGAATKLVNGMSQAFDCGGRRGFAPEIAQIFVVLDPNEVATAVLDCDKTVCGQGGVTQFVPWVDKHNDGNFVQPAACPAKGVLGVGQGVCVDYRQSTRDNAGDLHTYILFDKDVRMSH